MVDGSFKDLKLTDYKGKYLVFFFYPLDFTFVCKKCFYFFFTCDFYDILVFELFSTLHQNSVVLIYVYLEMQVLRRF